jgi:hypothetical protein
MDFANPGGRVDKSAHGRNVVRPSRDHRLSGSAVLEILTQLVDVSVSGWPQSHASRAATESRGRCSRTFLSPRDRALAMTRAS